MPRIIAQRVLTGEFLSWDVPFNEDASAVRELSGPGGVFGSIDPAVARMIANDGNPLIREWSTALYREDDNGKIHGGGIVVRVTEDEDGTLNVEAPGFSTYPHGIVHARTYTAPIGADALDVYRELWSYVQSFPDSDLAVTVDDTKSGELVEEVVELETGKAKKGDKGESEIVEPGHVIKPYRLPRWEYRDCGEEMNAMLEVASADYIEHHKWNADHTAIQHHIELGVPRLGKKRRDLRFVEGENIIEAVPLTIDGDEFAQDVYGIGKGEGRKMRHTRKVQRDDRIRRTALFVDKFANQRRLERLTAREFNRRNDTRGFESVVIRDHPNARIAQIDPGDDILIEAHLDWHGRVRLWNRVLSIETSMAEDAALLRVARSDQFRGGS